MIVILRHAEAQKNISLRHGGCGSPLSDFGRMQTRAIINKVSDLGITHIVSISRKQCIETAEIISKELNIVFSVEKDLQPFSLGVVDGLSEAEVKSLYPKVNENLSKWRNGNLEISEITIPGASDPVCFFNEGLRFVNEISNLKKNTLIIATRSILVLLYNVFFDRTPEIGGGYREVKWGNLEYAVFDKVDNGFSLQHETNGIINYAT